MENPPVPAPINPANQDQNENADHAPANPAQANPSAPAPHQPAPANPAGPAMPIPNQPAPNQCAPQIIHQQVLNWYQFKPEFAGRPEEDAEAHLLHTNDWMVTHNFRKM